MLQDFPSCYDISCIPSENSISCINEGDAAFVLYVNDMKAANTATNEHVESEASTWRKSVCGMQPTVLYMKKRRNEVFCGDKSLFGKMSGDIPIVIRDNHNNSCWRTMSSTTCESDSVSISSEGCGSSTSTGSCAKRIRTMESFESSAEICSEPVLENSSMKNIGFQSINTSKGIESTSCPKDTSSRNFSVCCDAMYLKGKETSQEMEASSVSNGKPMAMWLNPSFMGYLETLNALSTINGSRKDVASIPQNDIIQHPTHENFLMHVDNYPLNHPAITSSSQEAHRKQTTQDISQTNQKNHQMYYPVQTANVPYMISYRLPRSPTARAAIMLYPYPPLPPQCLPELRHAHHQTLFLQYLKTEPDPLKIQLAHFIIEHCTRSIPEDLFRSDTSIPNTRIIEDFVKQILYAVEVFGQQARHHHGRDPIPSDINELYISKWLQQKQHLLKPLQVLRHRRQQKQALTGTSGDLMDDRGERGSTRSSKNRRKIGVSLGEELDSLGIPRAIHYENLMYAIMNRGLVVQLPCHSDHGFKNTVNENGYGRRNDSASRRSLFNLLIAGRGDTRRSRLELPWGEVVKIKYNRTLLGIPDFVVEALGYGCYSDRSGSHHLIPKVCAVSLEDSPYGVEVLLFYRGMPCNKRNSMSQKKKIPTTAHGMMVPPTIESSYDSIQNGAQIPPPPPRRRRGVSSRGSETTWQNSMLHPPVVASSAPPTWMPEDGTLPEMTSNCPILTDLLSAAGNTGFGIVSDSVGPETADAAGADTEQSRNTGGCSTTQTFSNDPSSVEMWETIGVDNYWNTQNTSQGYTLLESMSSQRNVEEVKRTPIVERLGNPLTGPPIEDPSMQTLHSTFVSQPMGTHLTQKHSSDSVASVPSTSVPRNATHGYSTKNMTQDYSTKVLVEPVNRLELDVKKGSNPSNAFSSTTSDPTEVCSNDVSSQLLPNSPVLPNVTHPSSSLGTSEQSGLPWNMTNDETTMMLMTSLLLEEPNRIQNETSNFFHESATHETLDKETTAFFDSKCEGMIHCTPTRLATQLPDEETCHSPFAPTLLTSLQTFGGFPVSYLASSHSMLTENIHTPLELTQSCPKILQFSERNAYEWT